MSVHWREWVSDLESGGKWVHYSIIYTYTLCTCICTTHTHTYTCTYSHTWMCVGTRHSAHACMPTHTHMHTHTHAHTRTHTRVHAHTHTHLPCSMIIPPLKRCRKLGNSFPCTTRTCGPFSLSNSTVIRADTPFSFIEACSSVR